MSDKDIFTEDELYEIEKHFDVMWGANTQTMFRLSKLAVMYEKNKEAFEKIDKLIQNVISSIESQEKIRDKCRNIRLKINKEK